jgi:hypothetical protein
LENQSLRELRERDNTLDGKKEYCSFFVSMKQVQTEDFRTWIVAVRDVRTGHQQIFSNLDGLIQFLQTEFGNTAEHKELGQPDLQAAQILSQQ